MTAGRVDVADDVTAEAFSRLLAYDGRVRDPAAWVFRVAFRLAAAELKRERRLLPDGMPHASRVSDPAALSGELTLALRMLSAQQRVVVFLHYHADLPVSEIANLTGSSETAVKVRLHRARRQLRTVLTDYEGSHA